MSNSTVKASGKLEKGIIATPGERFLKGTKHPSRFQQKYATCGELDTQGFQKAGTGARLKKADPYDYSFDEMPI